MANESEQLLKPLCPDCTHYDEGACPVLARQFAAAGNTVLPHYCGYFEPVESAQPAQPAGTEQADVAAADHSLDAQATVQEPVQVPPSTPLPFEQADQPQPDLAPKEA